MLVFAPNSELLTPNFFGERIWPDGDSSQPPYTRSHREQRGIQWGKRKATRSVRKTMRLPEDGGSSLEIFRGSPGVAAFAFFGLVEVSEDDQVKEWWAPFL